MVRHIALFQFKAEVTQEKIDECFVALKGMMGRIPGIVGFEHGPYDSSEGLNEGFTHGFIMTFDSPESRDAYLPHPIHESVKDIVVPCLEKVVVFDFNLL
jgi:Stress responsive A/B Barrel Domain